MCVRVRAPTPPNKQQKSIKLKKKIVITNHNGKKLHQDLMLHTC